MDAPESLSERMISARLKFQGSLALKERISAMLIKPEWRKHFANTAFNLYLHSHDPIELSAEYAGGKGAFKSSEADEVLSAYEAGLSERHKGESVYHTHLLFRPAIAVREQLEPSREFDLMFQLHVPDEYVKRTLLAPPFNDAGTDRLLVTHHINPEMLREDISKELAKIALRSALLMNRHEVRKSDHLPGMFYATRPTVVKTEAARTQGESVA